MAKGCMTLGMNAAQLIQLLEKLDPQAEIVIETESGEPLLQPMKLVAYPPQQWKRIERDAIEKVKIV